MIARPHRQEVQEQAIRQGMLDLRRAALLKVAAGHTTTDELARIVPAERFVEAAATVGCSDF